MVQSWTRMALAREFLDFQHGASMMLAWAFVDTRGASMVIP